MAPAKMEAGDNEDSRAVLERMLKPEEPTSPTRARQEARHAVVVIV